MLSERDQRTVQKAKDRYSDIKIIGGLLDENWSVADIAKKMGAPESYVSSIIRRFVRPGSNE